MKIPKNRNNMGISNNRGFTLIEMIIVIVLVGGLMAILVPKIVNQFQTSATQNARNEIIDMMRSIDDGAQLNLTKYTTEISTLAQLVSTGILRTDPVPPPEAQDSNYTGTYAYQIDTSSFTTQFGTAAPDTVALLTGVTYDVCVSINEKFGLTSGGAAPPTTVSAGKDPQCFGTGGTSGYTVLKVIYTH